MLETLTLTVGQMATNCYIVFDTATKEGVIIDPGDESEYISETLLSRAIVPIRIIATHGHFDHIMGAYALKLAFGIPFSMHEKDAFLVSRMTETAKHFLQVPHVDPAPIIDTAIQEGDVIDIGSEHLRVMHVPGHTPGSICLYEKKTGVLCCGDTIFAQGATGRTDRSYASRDELRKSVHRILRLPQKTRLLSGHGEETSVAIESGFHVQ